MTTRHVPAGVEFAVRCLLIGVLGWLGALLYAAFTQAQGDIRVDESFVRMVLLGAVSFLAAAVIVRLLIRALGGWRHGVGRWQFAFFAAIVSFLAFALLCVVPVAQDVAAQGLSSLPQLVSAALRSLGLVVMVLLYPIWCFLAALLVGPGGSDRLPAHDPEPAPVTVR